MIFKLCEDAKLAQNDEWEQKYCKYPDFAGTDDDDT